MYMYIERAHVYGRCDNFVYWQSNEIKKMLQRKDRSYRMWQKDAIVYFNSIVNYT